MTVLSKPMINEQLQIFDNDNINVENIFINPGSDNAVIKNEQIMQIVTSTDFFKNIDCLDKYNLQELRNILKHYKNTIGCKNYKKYTNNTLKVFKIWFNDMYDFKLTGSKNKLIERIHVFFKKEQCAIAIQKNIRRFFVKMYLILKGPALKNRSLCINETDGFTLEPLSEIKVYDFFSYTSYNGNFIYGFDINSLINIMNKQCPGKFINPYNRDKMDHLSFTIKKIIRLQNIIKNNTKYNDHCKVQPDKKNVMRKSNILNSTSANNRTLTYNTTNNNNNNNNSTSTSQHRQLEYYNNYNSQEVILHIRDIRSKPFEERVRNLFIEIDHLGNYTQSSWFMLLDRRDYVRYFRCLFDIWLFRGQLSNEIKNKICPLWDPFIAFTSNPPNYSDLSREQIGSICLSVMEDMIYTGVDQEFKTLGAFHVLVALTIVSIPARNSMLWLYESIVY